MTSSFYALRELFNTAQMYPQKVALVLDDQNWTYSELIEQVQRVAYHLYRLNIVQGQIIYQFVDRSFEMICGLFGIMCAGGVYFPLNPAEPRDRLVMVLEQTQGQYVLLHQKTREKLPLAFVQHVVILNAILLPLLDVEHMSDLPLCSECGPAYIICTSGTTGRPKIVVHTHRSFSANTAIFLQWHFGPTFRDQVLQVATCSWITHLLEISLTLIIGGTLVLLRPGGLLDMAYFSQTLLHQQVSTFSVAPALTRGLMYYSKMSQRFDTFKFVRNLYIAGEAMQPQEWTRFMNFLNPFKVRFASIYAMSECAIVVGCQLQNIDYTTIPIGKPLPDVRCLLINEQGQIIDNTNNSNEIGQIYVGGSTLFNCYLDDLERTINTFVTIDNEVYIKTGDLARYNSEGELVHAGRTDFQIKIHGQRVETAEIENTIINWSPSKISNCLVIKVQQNDDLLVAYIISNDLELDIGKIRDYCYQKLRQYMVPSYFVVLDKLPLNANGKIDRKRLPTPEFSFHSSFVDDGYCREPNNEIEIHIHSLWCKILSQNQIPMNTNFFNIGGHSLLLVQLYHNYKITFNIDINTISIGKLFQYSTIEDHARLISESIESEKEYRKSVFQMDTSKAETSSIQNWIRIGHRENITLTQNESERYEPFPVTDIQQAYLIGREDLIELGHVSTFVYQEYDFPSTFDMERFEQAWNYLIQRHEALRIIFPSHIEQKILEEVPYYTISILNVDDVLSVENQLIERRQQLSHQVRPANQWPLFDIQVTRFLVDNIYYKRLHIGFDSLILDFWSIVLIFRELTELYFNSTITLTTLTLSYRDYILTEEQFKNTINYTNDKQYWINRLNSFPLGPNLPLKCLPIEIRTQRHSSLLQKLDRTVWKLLKQRINNSKLTPAGFLACVYSIVLAKWSENKHFTLNLPIFNRLPIHPQINEIAGDFTTIIPLEIDLSKPVSFDQFVQTIQKQLWSDLEHMSYNGVLFIRDLMQVHRTREVALPFVFTCGIDVIDTNEKNSRDSILFDQLPVYQISQTPQVFLDHIVTEENGHLVIMWVYVENLLSIEMITDMHRTFIELLQNLAGSVEMWQEHLSISLPLEQHQRRLNFNQTQWESNVKQKLLHSLVIEQAKQTPNTWAILSSRKNLTYEQLMNYVYPLAYYLQQQGVQSNQLIAILMKKGWEQIVACLSILIAGAAYLPLDIDSPYDRLCALIDETNIKIILTQSDCQHTFQHLITISVNTFTNDNYPLQFPFKEQLSTDLAYVIYTSGSTGKPKGVMINHQAVLNTILDINSRLKISTNDRIFALSHLHFDLSVYDIFGMLIAGGTIVIPDHENYKNPKNWFDMIIQHHVTIWNSVPMLMKMLVEHLTNAYNQNELRHILLSGDWILLSLPKSIQTTFGENITITSLGGATEASIWSIAFILSKEIPEQWKSIPYGIPLRNQHYYVYDSNLDDCPEWVNGELYIGGVGLADGYWNDQEKTKSSFIIHPHTGQRLYRTGDYGRFLPDGYIEFMGRKDFQVKIHGHRIELGEIEYNLQQHPDIHQAIVNFDKKSQQLIGYLMPEKHTIYNDDYDLSEIEITNSIERTNFKLTRHNRQNQYEMKKSYCLTKPELTERLIDTYYTRKSYRQFTNKIIEKSTIEYLLQKCHKKKNFSKQYESKFNFDTLSQFLSVLTPINVTGQPLPKYRYASAGSLYPVQMYIEIHTSINNISPGLYYHNPDKHILELVDEHVNGESMNIRLHFVGRSSMIAPLYGKKLGSHFCALETGYIIGLLQQEASKIGWILRRVIYDKQSMHIFDLNHDDTHYCFELSSVEEHLSDDNDINHLKCVIYLKSVEPDKDQWFFYDTEKNALIAFDMESDIKKEDASILFHSDDDTKIIFDDSQTAIFFIGSPEHRLNSGILSHLLMNDSLEMNIGMCPIGTRTNLPPKINNQLDQIFDHYRSNSKNVLLHTLLIGQISNEQKYERAISKVKLMPDWSETLRKYLSKRLPSYMIPFHFITVSTFPLSPNGKVDRNSLPEISSSAFSKEDTYIAPSTELEKIIENIWRELIPTDRLGSHSDDLELEEFRLTADTRISSRISSTTSFFDLGGDSLILVQIYRHYQALFNFDNEILTIRPFFECNTIADHAKLLETIKKDDMQSNQWHTLHINEGVASFVQERIFLDEQIRFSNKVAIYNELAVLKVVEGSLTIDRLSRALRYILSKHKILRTSLMFNNDHGILKQYITDQHQTFTLASKKIFKNENELQDIIYQSIIDPNMFDLSNGRVLHFQILQQYSLVSNDNDTQFIKESDIIIIAFHHIACDRSSFQIFWNDLCTAYNNEIWLDNEESLQYIDYSLHERLIDMTLSREFWCFQLEGYNLENLLSLPFDRHRSSTDQRSTSASVAEISFDDDIATSFLNYSSSHHLTPFQLGLATFYTFLFKLTYGQNDLCISCLNANRHRTELEHMIGMFVATLPYRIKLDPYWSFDELVQFVRKKCLSILEHSHYPLQHILVDSHLNQSRDVFLETAFDFITLSSSINQLSFDGAILGQVSLPKSSEVPKFDFILRFVYDSRLNDGKLSCRFICSRDLFEETTVATIAKRFQHLFIELFSSNIRTALIDKIITPISKLSLILPEEAEEIQGTVFHRLSSIVNQDAMRKSCQIIEKLVIITTLTRRIRFETIF